MNHRPFPSRSAVSIAGIFLTTVGMSSACRAAEWQWSVPDGQARAYLWVPPDCKQVRGVVVANHNMIEQGILEHPTMRKTLADLGMAEVWVVPAMDAMFDFNHGAGEHFEKLMGALAAESGYVELKFSPVVPIGHSACATYPWNFAAWSPGRTLAVLSVHGDAPRTNRTGNGKPNIDWGDRNIDGVPGLMVMGEYEWFEDRLAPALAFGEKHPATPVAMLCDAGHGHFDYSDELVSFLAMFVHKAAERRLPAEIPLDRPATLKPIDPKQGWRVDRWRGDQPPTAQPAPYEKYTGNPAEAFWCFDEEMAAAIEGYYADSRGKKPQLVAFVQEGKVLLKNDPRMIPLEDGDSFRLSGTFLDAVPMGNQGAMKWTGLPAGAPLGHAGSGGPVMVSRIVGPAAKTGPDTFAIRLDRSVYTANPRNNDVWMLASHPGDGSYKSAVQEAVVHIRPNTTGAEQHITFPNAGDQVEGVAAIKLNATSDANLPVSYYVREGPAEVNGNALEFTPIPPRSKFPVKVTIVAWQWGRAGDPRVRTATPVEMTFSINKQ